MRSRLPELVARLGSPRVFVLGDLILDRYVWGSVDRISPEAPIQILNVEREELRAGGAANVARNLASLGARVRCGGITGHDGPAAALARLLRASKIDPSAMVRAPGRPTAVKTRMIAHNQQVLRADRERTDPIGPRVARRLLGVARRAAARADLVIISDYDKGTLPPALCEAFVKRVRCPVLVGLKSRDYRKYAGATGAALNRKELLSISGETDVDRGARRIMRELALQWLVVTLGDRGLTVYARGAAPTTVPASARQIYDITGAGDTVLAALGLGYASGLSLPECALLADAAARVVVGKVGTATVTRDELRALSASGEDHGGLLSLPKLLGVLRQERASGRQIAFTNGCFDLIHAGHVAMLQFARSRGDVLVVGLNSDRSVRALKGRGRPIVSQSHRARLLTALQAVDYVVLFDEATPARLIGRIKPDVLVKGEDYRPQAVVGRGDAGRLELAPLVKGVSTSRLIERIRAL